MDSDHAETTENRRIEFRRAWDTWISQRRTLSPQEEFELLGRMCARDSDRALDACQEETRRLWREERTRAAEKIKSLITKMKSAYHETGIFMQFPDRPEFSEARGGLFDDEIADPEMAFLVACAVGGISAKEGLDREWLARTDGPPLIGDVANIVSLYREMWGIRRSLTSGQYGLEEAMPDLLARCFWIGRHVERAFVRSAEASAATGRRVRAGTEKGRTSRFGTSAEREARNRRWQTEIERLCRRRMSYRSARIQLAKSEGVAESTVKKHTKNPNPRKKK